MQATLREAIDEGFSERDAGLGVECSPAELMAVLRAEAGLVPRR